MCSIRPFPINTYMCYIAAPVTHFPAVNEDFSVNREKSFMKKFIYILFGCLIVGCSSPAGERECYRCITTVTFIEQHVRKSQMFENCKCGFSKEDARNYEEVNTDKSFRDYVEWEISTKCHRDSIVILLKNVMQAYESSDSTVFRKKSCDE